MAAPTFNAQRSIDVFTPPVGLITYPGLRPVARITRDREPLKPDLTVAEKEHETDPPTDTETDTETATILTSLDADTASPEDRLRYNRGTGNGDGRVENCNPRHRDRVFDRVFVEDACPPGRLSAPGTALETTQATAQATAQA